MFPLNSSDNHFYKAARLIDDVEDNLGASNGFGAGSNSWNNVRIPINILKL
jgi:hypothetical protein